MVSSFDLDLDFTNCSSAGAAPIHEKYAYLFTVIVLGFPTIMVKVYVEKRTTEFDHVWTYLLLNRIIRNERKVKKQNSANFMFSYRAVFAIDGRAGCSNF